MVQRRVSNGRRNLQFFVVMVDYAGEGMFRHLARPHVFSRPRRRFSH